MKIAVVSTGRSRCTLLAKYLHAMHPDLAFCGEFYNSNTISIFYKVTLSTLNGWYTYYKIDLKTSILLSTEL